MFSHASARTNAPNDWMLSVNLKTVTDGTSNTLLAGEKTVNSSTARPNPCNFGTDGTNYSGWLSQWGAVSSVSHGINYPYRYSYGNTGGIQFASRHVGGAQFALADGSVRFISQNVSMRILAALATRAGADTVGDF